MTMRYISLIPIVMLLAGCIFPYPHHNWTTPIFTGSVTRLDSGEPIEGAEIFIDGNPEDFVLSDENGLYELGPIKKLELFAIILPTAHPVPRVFDLMAVSVHGSQSVRTGSCIGDPGFECNGRVKVIDFKIGEN